MGQDHTVAVLERRLTSEKADYLDAYESEQREADYELAFHKFTSTTSDLFHNYRAAERRLYVDYRRRVDAATGGAEVLAARSDWGQAHDALTVAHDAAMSKQWLHLGVADRFDSYADWLAADCETRRRRVRAV